MLGLAPKEAPPTSNEIEWVSAYHSIVPMENARFSIFEARLLGMHCGKSPNSVMFDPWSPMNDPDFMVQQKKELEELEKQKKKEREKENVENS